MISIIEELIDHMLPVKTLDKFILFFLLSVPTIVHVYFGLKECADSETSKIKCLLLVIVIPLIVTAILIISDMIVG